jgi:hypothetical protein
MRNRRQPSGTILLAALFDLLGGALTAQAQARWPESGARVRVTVPCDPSGRPAAGNQRGCAFTGRFVAAGADSITVTIAEATTSYDLSAVSRLAVNRGYRSNWLAGAGVGLLVGAGATYLVLNSGGSTSLCDRASNQDAMSSGECLGATALGGVAGAGLGALVGSLIRSERWEDLPIERLRVGLAPRRGVTLDLRVAF